MVSFAELLGGASVAALEGAGFEVPEPAEVEDDVHGDVDVRDDASEDWERELMEVPAPTVRPREDARVAGTRTRNLTSGKMSMDLGTRQVP